VILRVRDMLIYLEDCSSERVSGIELHSSGHCDWYFGASSGLLHDQTRRRAGSLRKLLKPADGGTVRVEVAFGRPKCGPSAQPSISLLITTRDPYVAGQVTRKEHWILAELSGSV
jgi:hypothetical protein